jgi:hypothetical protein
MARVTVSVNVRDMTRGDLDRLRGRFNQLTQSVNMFSGRNSQRNLGIMRNMFADMDQEVRNLAGHIPHDEFDRLTRRVADFGVRMNTTGQSSQQQLGLMRSSLRELEREIGRVSGGTRGRVMRIRPEVEAPDRNRLTRMFTAPFRSIGGIITGTLSDGVGQGIVGGVKAGGPIAAAAIVAVIVSALSLAGAAIAGALVFALGGAFVGIAAMAAVKSKEVQETWKGAAKSIGEDLKAAGEPLIPVVQNAIQQLQGMSKEFAPHFKAAMEEVGPTVNGFIDATRSGFRKMGQHAWDDLTEAFRVFVTAFGPKWEDFLAEFGKSLGALARTVSTHSEEMAAALRIVLGAINALVDVINFFANLWVMSIHGMIDATAGLFNFLAFLTDAVLSFFGSILDGAVAAFSWIPGVGDQLKGAQDAFAQFREQAVSKLQEISDKADEYGANLDRNNKTRVLTVNIDAWETALTQAKEELKSVPPEKRTELLGRIADLENKIASANAQLRGMQKDYYVRIHAYKVGDWAIGLGGPQAHGGVTGNWGRAATGGARSNMTMVGEHGPELVNLPPGSHVRSNPDTKRLMNQSAAPSGGAQLVLKSSGRRVDDMLIEILREAIHQRGGDPVIVLGGGR